MRLFFKPTKGKMKIFVFFLIFFLLLSPLEHYLHLWPVTDSVEFKIISWPVGFLMFFFLFVTQGIFASFPLGIFVGWIFCLLFCASIFWFLICLLVWGINKIRKVINR